MFAICVIFLKYTVQPFFNTTCDNMDSDIIFMLRLPNFSTMEFYKGITGKLAFHGHFSINPITFLWVPNIVL